MASEAKEDVRAASEGSVTLINVLSRVPLASKCRY